jgi:hypothetical protein
VLKDLHWLIHQGHVIEFASGLLETAKKPLPRPMPAKPAQKAKPPADESPKESGQDFPPDPKAAEIPAVGEEPVPVEDAVVATAEIAAEPPTDVAEPPPEPQSNPV